MPTDLDIALKLCKCKADDIDHVRRDDDNQLVVYFTGKSKRRFSFEQQIEAFTPARPAMTLNKPATNGKSHSSAV